MQKHVVEIAYIHHNGIGHDTVMVGVIADVIDVCVQSLVHESNNGVMYAEARC